MYPGGNFLTPRQNFGNVLQANQGGIIMDEFQVATTEFTVECWLSPESSDPDNMIFDFRPSASLFFWRLQFNTINGLDIPQSYFPVNTWTHFALSWNTTYAAIFINGV